MSRRCLFISGPVPFVAAAGAASRLPEAAKGDGGDAAQVGPGTASGLSNFAEMQALHGASAMQHAVSPVPATTAGPRQAHGAPQTGSPLHAAPVSPLRFALESTVDFSTVLPAIFETAALRHALLPGSKDRRYDLPPLAAR